MSKHCILFVVDALTHRVTGRRIEESRVPNISRLVSSGGSLSECTSIFPSITPAATCSIATGQYPRTHGIQGACWFDPDANDAAYFGDDLKLALQEGLQEYLIDFADRLNFERLRQPLIYDHLHEAGIDSTCVNYMWFRGPHVHSRTTPISLKLISGGLDPEVRGPKYLKLGDFVDGLPIDAGDVEGMKSGILGRYGFHDATTAACMLALAESDNLTPFTIAYFPLNDDVAHKEGITSAASKCVERFDTFLGKFVDSIGGWDVVGDEYTFLIVGDHGQVEWSDDGPDVVRLDELLEDFKLADTAAGLQDDDELLVCPNMRASAVYSANPSAGQRDTVVDKLLRHPGVDQVIYEESQPDDRRSFTVATADRGRLRFARAKSDSTNPGSAASDDYGNRWSIDGELTPVGARIGADGNIIEGVYPNPLERIEGVFASGSSPIWATAKPSAEFAIQESSIHHGGSHGSLHRDDSDAALIATRDVDFDQLPCPARPRIVDVMDLCLSSLGISRSHIANSNKSAAPRT